MRTITVFEQLPEKVPNVRSVAANVLVPHAMAFLAAGIIFARPSECVADQETRINGATPLEWSVRMANSEMARRGDTLAYSSTGKATWDYAASLFADSLIALGERLGEPKYATFGEGFVGSFVTPEGEIRKYKIEAYSLDNVKPGTVLLELYQRTGEDRYKVAAQRLRAQLLHHPRTHSGGFWHKLRYPHQMWLDGLYMGEPFYAEYAARFGEPKAFDDIGQQFRIVAEHTYDPKTGLFYHAWDESKNCAWANKETGASPNFWSRAIGWYAMALVDTLDFFPADHPGRAELIELLRKTAAGLVKHQDPASGLWWQVTDQGSRPNNYLEASGSSMFVYAIAKGINKGYLSTDFATAVRAGYAGLVRDLVKTDPDGTVSLTQVCKVAGLDTHETKQRRDGSFDYYTLREPKIDNDLKGVGPFILAGLQMEKLSGSNEVQKMDSKAESAAP